MGRALARLLYIAVRVGFLLSIITIYPMQVHGWSVLLLFSAACGRRAGASRCICLDGCEGLSARALSPSTGARSPLGYVNVDGSLPREPLPPAGPALSRQRALLAHDVMRPRRAGQAMQE